MNTMLQVLFSSGPTLTIKSLVPNSKLIQWKGNNLLGNVFEIKNFEKVQTLKLIVAMKITVDYKK
jgi:hypothetical protein